jgi:hypothetical protein
MGRPMAPRIGPGATGPGPRPGPGRPDPILTIHTAARVVCCLSCTITNQQDNEVVEEECAPM